MRKYFYLVEREKDSSNIDYCLIRTSDNHDFDPGYYRISEDLAKSLHLKCAREESRIDDIRFDSQLFI